MKEIQDTLSGIPTIYLIILLTVFLVWLIIEIKADSRFVRVIVGVGALIYFSMFFWNSGRIVPNKIIAEHLKNFTAIEELIEKGKVKEVKEGVSKYIKNFYKEEVLTGTTKLKEYLESIKNKK